VHNDLAPKNVIVDRSTEPARICFVDWEMAGVGCGLLDLVDLKYGLDDASDQRMCAAYRDAIGDCDVLPRRGSECRRLFAACELHKTLYRLAFGENWGVSTERRTEWVRDAVRLRNEL
jgi:aminoglycoside phosphotransferase (APT) family kinase protein